MVQVAKLCYNTAGHPIAAYYHSTVYFASCDDMFYVYEFFSDILIWLKTHEVKCVSFDFNGYLRHFIAKMIYKNPYLQFCTQARMR